jgi:hypothetical protein
MQDPDADRRSKTLLGWLRRLFDKNRGSDWGSDWHWYDGWDGHYGTIDGLQPQYRPRSRV